MKIQMIPLLLLTLMASAAGAKGLVFSDNYILVPLKATTVTAAYGTIKNDSDKEVTLEIVEAKPFKAIEMHETVESNGKMAMHKMAQVKIPAHQNFELKPGGHHIMLFEPTREVKVGEQISVSFKVDGKTLETKFKVVARQN